MREDIVEKFGQWSPPPPFSGNAQKKTFFFHEGFHNASLLLMHNKKSVLPLHAILFYPWNWQVSWHSSPVRTPKNTSITLSLEHQSLTHLLNDPLTCLGRSGHPCGHSWHQAAAGSLLQLRLQHVAAWLLPPFGQIEHISEFLLDHFRSHQIKGATSEQ